MVLASLISMFVLSQEPTFQINSPFVDSVAFIGTPVYLSAYSIDADSATHSFRWVVSDGTELEGLSASWSPAATGVFTVTLTVTNASGQAASPQDRLLYVSEFDYFNSPKFTSVSSSARIVHEGDLVTLKAEGVNPRGTALDCRWSWLEGGVLKRASGLEVETQFSASAGGSQIVLYPILIDADGFVSFTSGLSIFSIYSYPQGENLPPEPVIVQPQGDQISVNPGTEVQFVADGTDAENDLPLSFKWILPDGRLVEGDTVSYTFYEGEQSVNLRAVDSQGNESPYLDMISVRVVDEETSLPLASVYSPLTSTRIFEDESLFLSGLALVGNVITEGTWRFEEVTGRWPVFEVSGSNPGRVSLPGHGLYQMTFFMLDGLGNSSAVDSSNSKWIAVQKRSGFEPPELEGDYDDGALFYVKEGESVTLAVEVEDVDPDSVRIFWEANGRFLGEGGLRETFLFQYDTAIAGFGVTRYLVSAQAVGTNGQPATEPVYFSVFVYTDHKPLVAQVQGFPSGSTIFMPLGSSYTPVLTLEGEDGVELDHDWRLYEPGSAGYIWTSDVRDPEAIALNKTGAFILYYLAYSVDRTTGTIPGFAGNIVVYDPNELPEATIIEPTEGRLQLEVGSTQRFSGVAIDPNFFPSDEAFTFFDHVTNVLDWVVEKDGQPFQTFPAVAQFQQTFTEVGSYRVLLNATNSLGLSDPTPDEVLIEVVESLPDALEPNDTRATAALIQAGSLGNLTLSDSDPVDWYRFDLTRSGDVVRFNFDQTSALADIQLSLFKEDALIKTQTLSAGKVHAVNLISSGAASYYLELRLEPGNKRINGLSFGISLATLVPQLSFPFPKHDSVDETLLSVVNPFGQVANLVFEAKDKLGAALAQSQYTLPPNGRIEARIPDLFPGVSALKIQWVQVQSDLAVVGLSTTLSLDQKTALAEPAVIGGYDQLVVPHIAQDTATWYTRAAVANVSQALSNANFNTSQDSFPIVQIANPQQGVLFDFLDFFGGFLPTGSQWGTFAESTGDPILSGIEIFGKKTGDLQVAALSLSSSNTLNPNLTRVRNNLYFPHVAQDIQNFWTALAFVNTGNATSGITLKAYFEDGSLAAEETFSMEAGAKKASVARALFSGLASDSPISWIELETDGDIVGYELFGSNDGGNKRLAGFPAMTGGGSELVFAKVWSGDGAHWTGVATVNLSTSDTANLVFSAYDDGGNLLGMANTSLGPKRKVVALASNLFSGGLPAGTTWLRLSSNKPLAAFQLFGDLSGEFMAGTLAQ